MDFAGDMRLCLLFDWRLILQPKQWRRRFKHKYFIYLYGKISESFLFVLSSVRISQIGRIDPSVDRYNSKLARALEFGNI